jgi:hypothetical protein
MKKTSVGFVVCLLFAVPAVRAANITIDAFCRTDLVGGGSIETTFSSRTSIPTTETCFAGPVFVPGPQAPFGQSRPHAAARVIVDYGVSDGDFFASGDMLVSARQPGPPVQNGETRAVAFWTLDLVVWSAGPTRPGQILWNGGGFANGSGSGHDEEGDFGCVKAPAGSFGSSCGAGSLPTTLGEPFPVHLDGRAFAGVCWDGSCSDADAQVSFNVRFQLQELDGTPVAVQLFPVPEPTTFVLFTSVLLVLALRQMISRTQ